MSPQLAGIVGSSFDQSDWLKLLGIAGAAVALYFIAKRLGGGGESYPPPTESPGSTQLSAGQTAAMEPREDADSDEGDLEEPADEEYATEEGESQPCNITIADWSFATFEIAAGPPDPNVFADDLSVNLYDKSTGHAWNQDYFVATPAGLEKMLRDSKSNFVFLPKILVMHRYDKQDAPLRRARRSGDS